MADHLLDQLAPLHVLTAVAQVTTTMRVGTFVLNNDLRHPALLAQELASLDLLSEADSTSASARAGTSTSTSRPG